MIFARRTASAAAISCWRGGHGSTPVGRTRNPCCCTPKAWRSSADGCGRWRRCWPSASASPLQDGDISAAEALLSRLQALAEDADKSDVAHTSLALSRCRVLMAKGEAMAAALRLDTLAAEQERCGEWLFAVRLRLLQAQALWQANAPEQAVAVSVPALRRAVRQKLLRSLLDGGPALASLLQLIAKRGAAGAEFSADLTQLLAHFAAAGIPLSAGRAAPPDVRLTERERQTLRLIAEGYSNKGMARELGISAETVQVAPQAAVTKSCRSAAASRRSTRRASGSC
ncbi:transcriptional regulator NarL [Raoultella terrigena]|uniref:Transcriptional regulator NarL n=1 Tax=Raoultella terrigena TaxID=577 RepID=A0A4U9CZU8_RAOTE|nr:transcriptional regulator NarL [Raoultella terrigena]